MDRYQRVPVAREPEDHAENEVRRAACGRAVQAAHRRPAASCLSLPAAALRGVHVLRPPQVRITSQGKSRSYISYGTSLLSEKGHSSVVLKAMGKAINKTVTIGAPRAGRRLALPGWLAISRSGGRRWLGAEAAARSLPRGRSQARMRAQAAALLPAAAAAGSTAVGAPWRARSQHERRRPPTRRPAQPRS